MDKHRKGGWIVRKNGRKHFWTDDAEAAIGFVADRTGLAREHIAEETRKGHAVQEGEQGGSGALWTIEGGV